MYVYIYIYIYIHISYKYLNKRPRCLPLHDGHDTRVVR